MCVRLCELQAQHERADNCFLRAENDKIRCENITMREALKNVICPSCGGPPVAEDFFDEQKLRMENARLKEEVNHELTTTRCLRRRRLVAGLSVSLSVYCCIFYVSE
jgi:homeobox-leucine zipper protein